MAQIKITRSNGTVSFTTANIDITENVFFTNLDPQQAHWPSLCQNQLDPAPSPNSIQCMVPPPASLIPPANQVPYTCKIHESEKGLINVFAVLAAKTTTLPPATKGSPITAQQVVAGGMSPYAISDQLFQITDGQGNVIQSGSDIAQVGLQLNATTDSKGITVTGTPTVSGTYAFTFTVNDAMGKNLQQVQYSMKVA